MIDLYTWTTPNGRKVSIMLEELGVDYTAHSIDIFEGRTVQPGFSEKSPPITASRRSLTMTPVSR